MENTATLAPETAINEKLDILIEAVRLLQQEMVAIRDRIDENEDDVFPDPREDLKAALLDVKAGRVYPIETLWDGIDAE